MSALRLSMVSPLGVYLDEETTNGLAPRPSTLEGKVIALLPNWRPSALDLLRAVGEVMQQSCNPRAIVLEQPDREVPVSKGKLLDGLRAKLDDIAQRVDAVITASGD